MKNTRVVFIEAVNADCIGFGPGIKLTWKRYGSIICCPMDPLVPPIAEEYIKFYPGRQFILVQVLQKFAAGGKIFPAGNINRSVFNSQVSGFFN